MHADHQALTDELLASGIPLEYHSRLYYAALTPEQSYSFVGYRLPGWVVGFYHLDGTPMLCADGRQFMRLKPSWPADAVGKPKYLTIAGEGCRPYFSPFIASRDPQGTSPIDITEGEKKADAACIAGFDTISISGVDAWRDKRSGSSDILPELAALNWNGRTVRLCFDSDVAAKASVRGALRALAFELTHRDAHVLITQLPCEIPDGPGNPTPSRWKNGLDDFIVRHGAEAYRILRNQARECVSTDNDGNLTWGWSHTPKALLYKSTLAWAVFKDRYIVDEDLGLFRWNGVIWEQQTGDPEARLRTELVWWMDAMGWVEQPTSALVIALIDRLRRVDTACIPWDRPGLTAFANGTLDETTGIFTPAHSRHDHLTFAFQFDWDPSARCPRWAEFLTEATAGCENTMGLIQAAFNWTLQPKDISNTFPIEHCFDITGRKGTGKSTVAEVLYALAGGSHGAGVFRSGMIDNPAALWCLRGKRAGIEFDAAGHIGNVGVFNSIVSNEPVLVKRLYQNESLCRLGIVLWRIHNDAPSVSSAAAEGLGRRLITIPFLVEPAERDVTLKATLLKELAGIYQWVRAIPWPMVAETFRTAMAIESIRDAATEALLERNSRLQWLLETYGSGCTDVSMGTLFSSWKTWADANGHQVGSSSWLGRELRKIKGVTIRRSGGATGNQTLVSIQPMNDYDLGRTLGLSWGEPS